jgi:hypothetical protein
MNAFLTGKKTNHCALFARVGFTAVYDKKLADLSAKLAGERGSAAAAIQVIFGYLSTIF